MNDVARAPGEFGRLVRKYREARNMSQERLAQEAGLSNGYISLLETGRRGERPSRDTVIGIAQALRASIPELLHAAGRLEPGDDIAPDSRPTFADFVRTDPNLRSDQKVILIDLYNSWVRGG